MLRYQIIKPIHWIIAPIVDGQLINCLMETQDNELTLPPPAFSLVSGESDERFKLLCDSSSDSCSNKYPGSFKGDDLSSNLLLDVGLNVCDCNILKSCAVALLGACRRNCFSNVTP